MSKEHFIKDKPKTIDKSQTKPPPKPSKAMSKELREQFEKETTEYGWYVSLDISYEQWLESKLEEAGNQNVAIVNHLVKIGELESKLNIKEIWKVVLNFEGLYEVSNLGNVSRDGKLLNPSLSTSGYPFVSLSKDGVKTSSSIHRLMAESFLNHTSNGYDKIIDHIDNDKENNVLGNLQIVSVRENTTKDRVGSSKYVGVCWDKSCSKWIAQIRIGNKRKTLGRFSTEEEASEAYQNELKKQ